MEILLDRPSRNSAKGWSTCLRHGMTTDPGHDCRLCSAEKLGARPTTVEVRMAPVPDRAARLG